MMSSECPAQRRRKAGFSGFARQVSDLTPIGLLARQSASGPPGPPIRATLLPLGVARVARTIFFGLRHQLHLIGSGSGAGGRFLSLIHI